jgi:hypothetical protein
MIGYSPEISREALPDSVKGAMPVGQSASDFDQRRQAVARNGC